MKTSCRLSVTVLATVGALFAAGCQKKPLIKDPGQVSIVGPPTKTIDDLSADNFPPPRDPTIDGTKGKRGILPNIYFAFDSAAIGQAERTKFASAVDYLKANPNSRLLLEGHCDWRGTEDYNLGLGDRRATAVRQYLATLGVAGARLETLSVGDHGAKEGGSAAEMQEDRRVELAVLD